MKQQVRKTPTPELRLVGNDGSYTVLFGKREIGAVDRWSRGCWITSTGDFTHTARRAAQIVLQRSLAA